MFRATVMNLTESLRFAGMGSVNIEVKNTPETKCLAEIRLAALLMAVSPLPPRALGQITLRALISSSGQWDT